MTVNPWHRPPMIHVDHAFWPRAHQVPACWFLGAIILAEWATLAWAIIFR